MNYKDNTVFHGGECLTSKFQQPKISKQEYDIYIYIIYNLMKLVSLLNVK